VVELIAGKVGKRTRNTRKKEKIMDIRRECHLPRYASDDCVLSQRLDLEGRIANLDNVVDKSFSIFHGKAIHKSLSL